MSTELTKVADGKGPKVIGSSQPLSDYLCEQVLEWLRKAYLAECVKK